MSIDRFISRNPLACAFVALHTLLVGAYAWIELNHAWNDMNPTMLVMAALYIGDYPVNILLRPLINGAENVGTYLAALLVLGGIFWFGVGTLLTFAWQPTRRLFAAWRSMPRAAWITDTRANASLHRMSKIDNLFTTLRREKRKALMPFITAGDPDLDFTAAVIHEVVKRGCHLCEIGIPYSDPIADGPVIQASYTRALAHKIKLADILKTLGDVAPKVAAPLVTMVSYAIVYRHGLEKYVDEVQQRGLAGLIVPDLPVEESTQLAAICGKRGISLIQLVTPTTPRERAVRIANTSTGFLYYVSVAGITGERTALPPELVENVGWLRTQTGLPICIGFGISKPEHVKLLAPVADGLIVGSAIVRRIATAVEKPREQVLHEVGKYVAELLSVI